MKLSEAIKYWGKQENPVTPKSKIVKHSGLAVSSKDKFIPYEIH